MKLYDSAIAPNPKKVRIYLAEKGLTVPIEPVDIMTGQNRSPEMLAKNPSGGLPFLELDDGTCVPESLAIIEYFEERHPTPPMIGSTPEERLKVRALERHCELGVLNRIAQIFQNTSPFFAGRITQSAEAAENARGMLANALALLDAAVGARPFLAGDRPTIADCTLVAALQFGEFAGIPLDPRYGNLTRWYADFQKRPSAQA